MKLSSVLVSDQCSICEFGDKSHISNPICVSCQYCRVVVKYDNFTPKKESENEMRLKECEAKHDD